MRRYCGKVLSICTQSIGTGVILLLMTIMSIIFVALLSFSEDVKPDCVDKNIYINSIPRVDIKTNDGIHISKTIWSSAKISLSDDFSYLLMRAPLLSKSGHEDRLPERQVSDTGQCPIKLPLKRSTLF